eukprot:69992_1
MLDKLQSDPKIIKDKQLFWKFVDLTPSNQMITTLLTHPLISENVQVKMKLIEELNLNLLHDDVSKIQYLVQISKTYPSFIEKQSSLFEYTKQFIKIKHVESIPKLTNNPAFLRLYELLPQYSKFFELLAQCLYINDTGCVTVNNTKYHEFDYLDADDEIGKYQFVVQRYTTNNLTNDFKLYTFDNLIDFNIPFVSKHINDVCNIYVKPVDSYFRFGKFHELYRDIYCGRVPQYGKYKGKYKLNTDTLTVDETIAVDEFNKNYGTGGAIQIFCVSPIIITKRAKIDADECGMNKEMSKHYFWKQPDTKQTISLQYGGFYDNNLSSDHDARGGGIIELVSKSQITNNGLLTCNGANQSSGGTIFINTLQSFVNNGKIEAHPHGQIIIKCPRGEFKDNGNISPTPTVIYTNNKNDSQINFSVINKPWCNQHLGTEIMLRYHKCHGYRDELTGFDDFHPAKLLSKSTETIYRSKKNKTVGDWIIFKTHRLSRITKITIKNRNEKTDICCIDLFVKSTETSKWNLLCSIKNIKKQEYAQNFILCEYDAETQFAKNLLTQHKIKSTQNNESRIITLLLSDYFMYKSSFNQLKVQITKNHGSKEENSFTYFGLFGEISDNIADDEEKQFDLNRASNIMRQVTNVYDRSGRCCTTLLNVNEAELEEFDKKEEIFDFGFGTPFSYWPEYTYYPYIGANYKSLKNELLNNNISSITMNEWNQVTRKAETSHTNIQNILGVDGDKNTPYAQYNKQFNEIFKIKHKQLISTP